MKMKTSIMTKEQALNAIVYFKTTHAATDNTTLGDLSHNYWCASMVDWMRDSFADLTWDTTLGEAREIVINEND